MTVKAARVHAVTAALAITTAHSNPRMILTRTVSPSRAVWPRRRAEAGEIWQARTARQKTPGQDTAATTRDPDVDQELHLLGRR